MPQIIWDDLLITEHSQYFPPRVLSLRIYLYLFWHATNACEPSTHKIEGNKTKCWMNDDFRLEEIIQQIPDDSKFFIKANIAAHKHTHHHYFSSNKNHPMLLGYTQSFYLLHRCILHNFAYDDATRANIEIIFIYIIRWWNFVIQLITVDVDVAEEVWWFLWFFSLIFHPKFKCFFFILSQMAKYLSSHSKMWQTNFCNIINMIYISSIFENYVTQTTATPPSSPSPSPLPHTHNHITGKYTPTLHNVFTSIPSTPSMSLI